jgi:hypothetical protein
MSAESKHEAQSGQPPEIRSKEGALEFVSFSKNCRADVALIREDFGPKDADAKRLEKLAEAADDAALKIVDVIEKFQKRRQKLGF